MAEIAIGQPTFQGLGYPTGRTSSYAHAISADGRTVAGGNYRWTATTGWQDLGLFPGADGQHASSISADGAVIVGWAITSGGERAFRWSAATGSVNLGLPIGSLQANAAGVSLDGSVICGQVEVQPTCAFRWTAASGFQLLGFLPGGDISIAKAMSGDGTTIVGYATSPNGSGAFRWTAAGGMQDLGAAAGYSDTRPKAVSHDGSVVVGEISAGFGTSRAFRWTAADGIRNLGVPGYATGVSGDGRVIVGISGAAGFIWTTERGAADLRALLGSAMPPGWTLDPYGVSADGLHVAGWGYNPSGRPEAWLAILTPDMLTCYPNCDTSTIPPILNVNDFTCFLNRFAAGDPRANCDGSTVPPILNVNDFACFANRFAAGCD